jgi:NAD(P)-dependent dehydrogenase (short-subunit alcohol dehydrogenase family)
MRLQGRKALITGGSRGIGQAIAVAFAREGADVVVTARSADALAETISLASAQGVQAAALEWDVQDVTVAPERLRQASELVGGLDTVVNNAGVLRLAPDHPNPTAEAAWDQVIDTNLKGTFFICQAAAELFRERGGGVIVNIASDAGHRGTPSAYGASKWGVVGLTRGLAREWAKDHIRVNAVSPGPVATDMMGWHPGQPLDAPSLPLGRYSLPEEIARVALFLASDDSSAVFGQSIVVNSSNP